MQTIAASWLVAVLSDCSTFAVLVETHLRNMAGHRVGNRPNRVEPRAVKRRAKPHHLLAKPHIEARREVLAGICT